MLRQAVLAAGRPPAPPAAAKKSAVARSEQHKRAGRAQPALALFGLPRKGPYC